MAVSKQIGTTLFIFAHQDDEYFALPWIQEELRSSNSVLCVYLTDGGSRTDPEIRNDESTRAMLAVGVQQSNIRFVGSDEGISDGQLVHHLSRAHASVERWLIERGIPVNRVYAPDYEGGHPDHDAAHILAATVARNRGISNDSWSFALYNASQCPRPAFRVLRLIERPGLRTIRYSLVEGLRLAMFCWRYPSQRGTWLGLFPESLLRRVLLRRESVNPLRTPPVTERPHEGDLLYERMFGVTYSDFASATASFEKDIL